MPAFGPFTSFRVTTRTPYEPVRNVLSAMIRLPFSDIDRISILYPSRASGIAAVL